MLNRRDSRELIAQDLKDTDLHVFGNWKIKNHSLVCNQKSFIPSEARTNLWMVTGVYRVTRNLNIPKLIAVTFAKIMENVIARKLKLQLVRIFCFLYDSLHSYYHTGEKKGKCSSAENHSSGQRFDPTIHFSSKSACKQRSA